MTQKKYPLCLVCQKTYTERKGLRFRHFDDAGLFWHNAKPVFPVKLVKSKKETLPELVPVKKLVEAVATDWPVAIGDVNMADVVLLGWRIFSMESLKLPEPDWSKDFGIQVVETIDRELIKMLLIRNRKPKDLADGSERIVEWFYAHGVQWYGPTILVTSFFAWQGCISAMKMTRPTYNAHPVPLPYSQDLRWCGYYSIQHEWKTAMQHGNPWIRYGVTLARALALARKNEIIDDWVPKDSPYWDESEPENGWLKKAAAMEDAAGGFPGVSGAMVRHMKPKRGLLGLPIPPLKPGEIEMDAGDEL